MKGALATALALLFPCVALAHFQEAYRIKPHPVVRVNMANCYDRLGKPLPAIFHFERFLDESDPNAAQRKEVTEALSVLRGKVSELTLRVAPDGASVTIDDGERRQSPILEPVRLEAGRHVIEVALSGYQTQKRDVMLEGGQPREATFRLERASAPREPQPSTNGSRAGQAREVLDLAAQRERAVEPLGISAQRDLADACNGCCGRCARTGAGRAAQRGCRAPCLDAATRGARKRAPFATDGSLGQRRCNRRGVSWCADHGTARAQRRVRLRAGARGHAQRGGRHAARPSRGVRRRARRGGSR